MGAADGPLATLFGMHGKHVIVTGASSGMGTAVAELFVAPAEPERLQQVLSAETL